MNPNTFSVPQNRPYLIAGIGAIVGFIAFFLPFAIISRSSTTDPLTGNATNYPDISRNAADIGYFPFWLAFILLLAVIAASALFIFRSNNPYGITTKPLEQQARWTLYGFIGVGALNILLVILALSTYIGNINNVYDYFGVHSSISVVWGFGMWLFLLTMLVVAAGGALPFILKTPLTSAIQNQYSTNPYAPQGPQYPYPPVPGQTPQYPGQYPSTQYPAQGQPQYPPTQYSQGQQYPPQGPQQYPPQYPQQ